MISAKAHELQKIYDARFARSISYRRKVWAVLVESFFQKYVPVDATVLDLGCGYGEFINQVNCGKKFAMDLNPDAPKYLAPTIDFLEWDCSERWPFEENFLQVVFSSNFFEHLANKTVIGQTVDEIFRCLAPGGKLIAIGPNVRYLAGEYWDFWDHQLPLTELSLSEGLASRGLQINESIAKFLPYTMVNQREYPAAVLRLYLRCRPAWRIFGKQFLVIASKPK